MSMRAGTVTADNATVAKLAVHFSDSDIAGHLDYASLVDHIAHSYSDPIATPVRVGVEEKGLELLVMPAVSSRYAGTKILTIRTDNETRGLPTIGGFFVLFDAATGATLATMDAAELTARRTAAVSALASRQLSRPDASHLLMIGAGKLVPHLAEAHAAVRPLQRISIWARRPEKAAIAVDRIRLRLPDIMVEIAADLDSALAEADIVSTATRSTEPLVRGSLLRPGTHVDAVGGYRPQMREVDDELVARARIYVDNREAVLAEAGDILSPLTRGIITADAIVGDLPSIAARAAQRQPDEISLFKSVGSANTDLAAAELLWQRGHA